MLVGTSCSCIPLGRRLNEGYRFCQRGRGELYDRSVLPPGQFKQPEPERDDLPCSSLWCIPLVRILAYSSQKGVLNVVDSDSPLSLVTAAMQSIPVLTGTEKTGFDFALYTGDLVAHDPEHQLSR